MPPMKCATNAEDAHGGPQVANLQLDGAKQPHNDPAGWQPAGCQA